MTMHTLCHCSCQRAPSRAIQGEYGVASQSLLLPPTLWHAACAAFRTRFHCSRPALTLFPPQPCKHAIITNSSVVPKPTCRNGIRNTQFDCRFHLSTCLNDLSSIIPAGLLTGNGIVRRRFQDPPDHQCDPS